MAATIFMIRHGQSHWQKGTDRSNNAELSPLGHNQCRYLPAAKIKGDVVLSSPLRRACQTVQYLGGAELSPVEICEALREAEFHIGSEDGTRSNRPLTERYLTYLRGIHDTMKWLEDKYLGAGWSVVAVTHNGFIKCLLRTVLNAPDLEIKVANCSVTSLQWNGTWDVREIGTHTHVPPNLLTY
ncbi:MAG: histidine phosphatase family protein [Paracoccaceae bacterium]|nr:histidine phosphatase family protein [Paracoccaceae bacterium]